MLKSERATVGEHDHVVYAGAVLIPFCVGSVALPLTLCRASSSASLSALPASSARRGNQQRQRRRKEGHDQATPHESGSAEEQYDYSAGISRCTHVRYCYLRDGAVAAQDLAYRRACHETSSTKSALTTSEECDVALSASPLYALVERVVFKLPNSFPEPRRELTRPPFFVVDDTWAEHMVEMEVHFRSWLGIAPFVATHMVLLQTRADLPPQLLSSTFGQTKPPPTVIFPSLDAFKTVEEALIRRGQRSSTSQSEEISIANNDNNEEGVSGELGICVNLEDLEDIPIVSERRDAIRIFHPTLKVVQYLETLQAVPQPMLESPPCFCVLPGRKAVAPQQAHMEERDEGRDSQHRTGEKRRSCNDVTYVKARETSTLPPWCFPFEAIMHAHEPKRQGGSVDAMRAVLAALKKEQDELREGIEQRISSAVANAEELRGVIQRMQATCALLEKQEMKEVGCG